MKDSTFKDDFNLYPFGLGSAFIKAHHLPDFVGKIDRGRSDGVTVEAESLPSKVSHSRELLFSLCKILVTVRAQR